MRSWGVGAYAEIHDDETATTATGVLSRAVSWFADRGVRVERVLSDNGSAYKSHAWHGHLPGAQNPRLPLVGAEGRQAAGPSPTSTDVSRRVLRTSSGAVLYSHGFPCRSKTNRPVLRRTFR